MALAQPTPPTDAPTESPSDNPTTNSPPQTPSPEAPASADTAVVTGTIRSPDLEAPLSGAKVTVEGTNISAITDESGRFSLNAPPGKITIRADFGGFRSIEKQLSVSAGREVDVDLPLSLDQLLTEVVVVVGSRTPRTNVETTAPVDVVTAEEISHVGKTETGRILTTLAPSFISEPQTVADGTDHVDPASLRGLGPDQVLVLVNGKRRHKSALLNVNGTFGRGTVGTDLNAIPVEEIKRIEILRDGAASQYGSDAIAGVINIVTKDYTDLLDVSSMGGETGSSDGEQIKAGANYGFKIGKKGFLNLTGSFLKKDPTNRAGQYTGEVFVADPTQDNAEIAAKGLTRDDFRMRIGEAGEESTLGGYNMELPIDDASTFYSFGDLGHRNGNAAGFYRFPFQETQIVSTPQFYPNGFLPVITSNINDLEVTAGVRRKGDWNVDASVTHGQNSFQFGVENSVNASLGTLSPTSFNSGTLMASETLGDLDLLRKIDTGGALKSLNFVAGSEVRTENYQIQPGDPASYEFGTPTMPGIVLPDGKTTAPGAQVFPGFSPDNAVNRNRNNVGLYAGLESEVIKGLNLDIGGRYENYSDFGNSVTGKAAVRIPLGSMLAIRGAASTGFRAPSLQQLWFNNTSSVFLQDPATGQLQFNEVLTSNNASPITKAFGIPQLKQETSNNLSGGLTFRPFENLSVTADGYFIQLKNRIVLTGTFATNVANPMLATDIKTILSPFTGVTGAQFFANAVDTNTMGADVVADYAIDTGAGTVIVSGAANFTKTTVEDVHIPTGLAAAFSNVDTTTLDSIFFDRLAKNRLEDSVPHQKGILSVRYNYKALSALARADYYGKVRYKPDAVTGKGFANDEVFGAKTLFDADLGYQFTKNMQLVLGADNLLNTFPDKNTKAANINNGNFIYNRNVSQFGWNGGFYYLKLELTFF